MIRLITKLLLLASILLSSYTQAALVVIVNPQSGVEQLTRNQVIKIFLGSHRELPNKLAARPVDLPDNSAGRADFYQRLVNKDLDQMSAYWARLIFAGNTLPPDSIENEMAAVHYVASKPGGIAYVDSALVDKSVRIVFSLP